MEPSTLYFIKVHSPKHLSSLHICHVFATVSKVNLNSREWKSFWEGVRALRVWPLIASQGALPALLKWGTTYLRLQLFCTSNKSAAWVRDRFLSGYWGVFVCVLNLLRVLSVWLPGSLPAWLVSCSARTERVALEQHEQPLQGRASAYRWVIWLELLV